MGQNLRIPKNHIWCGWSVCNKEVWILLLSRRFKTAANNWWIFVKSIKIIPLTKTVSFSILLFHDSSAVQWFCFSHLFFLIFLAVTIILLNSFHCHLYLKLWLTGQQLVCLLVNTFVRWPFIFAEHFSSRIGWDMMVSWRSHRPVDVCNMFITPLAWGCFHHAPGLGVLKTLIICNNHLLYVWC